MMPKNIYIIRTPTKKVLSYQGKSKAHVLGFIQKKHATKTNEFIKNKVFKILKTSSETYAIHVHPTKKTIQRTSIEKCDSNDIMIIMGLNNITFDIINDIEYVQSSSTSSYEKILLYSHHKFIDNEIDVDIDLYRENLNAIYYDREFDLDKYLSSLDFLDDET